MVALITQRSVVKIEAAGRDGRTVGNHGALPGTPSSLSTDPLFESFFTDSLVLVSSEPPSDGVRVETHAGADAE